MQKIAKEKFSKHEQAAGMEENPTTTSIVPTPILGTNFQGNDFDTSGDSETDFLLSPDAL